VGSRRAWVWAWAWNGPHGFVKWCVRRLFCCRGRCRLCERWWWRWLRRPALPLSDIHGTFAAAAAKGREVFDSGRRQDDKSLLSFSFSSSWLGGRNRNGTSTVNRDTPFPLYYTPSQLIRSNPAYIPQKQCPWCTPKDTCQRHTRERQAERENLVPSVVTIEQRLNGEEDINRWLVYRACMRSFAVVWGMLLLPNGGGGGGAIGVLVCTVALDWVGLFVVVTVLRRHLVYKQIAWAYARLLEAKLLFQLPPAEGTASPSSWGGDGRPFFPHPGRLVKKWRYVNAIHAARLRKGRALLQQICDNDILISGQDDESDEDTPTAEQPHPQQQQQQQKEAAPQPLQLSDQQQQQCLVATPTPPTAAPLPPPLPPAAPSPPAAQTATIAAAARDDTSDVCDSAAIPDEGHPVADAETHMTIPKPGHEALFCRIYGDQDSQPYCESDDKASSSLSLRNAVPFNIGDRSPPDSPNPKPNHTSDKKQQQQEQEPQNGCVDASVCAIQTPAVSTPMQPLSVSPALSLPVIDATHLWKDDEVPTPIDTPTDTQREEHMQPMHIEVAHSLLAEGFQPASMSAHTPQEGAASNGHIDRQNLDIQIIHNVVRQVINAGVHTRERDDDGHGGHSASGAQPATRRRKTQAHSDTTHKMFNKVISKANKACRKAISKNKRPTHHPVHSTKHHTTSSTTTTSTSKKKQQLTACVLLLGHFSTHRDFTDPFKRCEDLQRRMGAALRLKGVFATGFSFLQSYFLQAFLLCCTVFTAALLPLFC